MACLIHTVADGFNLHSRWRLSAELAWGLSVTEVSRCDSVQDASPLAKLQQPNAAEAPSVMVLQRANTLEVIRTWVARHMKTSTHRSCRNSKEDAQPQQGMVEGRKRMHCRQNALGRTKLAGRGWVREGERVGGKQGRTRGGGGGGRGEGGGGGGGRKGGRKGLLPHGWPCLGLAAEALT